jgi:hypothetical protein
MMRRSLVCLAALWTVWCSILLTAVVMEHTAQRAESVREILMLVAGAWFVCGLLCWMWAFIKGSPSARGSRAS